MIAAAGVHARPLVLLLVIVLGIALAPPGLAQPAATVDLNLPAQPLAEALRQIAQRFNVPVRFDAVPMAGRTAPEVRGALSAEQALARALAGSGLAAQRGADGGFTVRTEAAMLDAVQVTGFRSTVDVPDRVLRGQANEVRDLFATEAEVDVGGGTRNGQRLYVRGIEGSLLNVTIDGARQGSNLYNHRGGLNNIDPEIVKRLEIDAGPPAADDGYGALGGSVRFETIDAQDRLPGGQRFGALGKVAYASVNDLLRGAVGAFGRAGDNIGLLAYFSHADYNDLTIGGGDRVPFSGGRDRTALVKASVLDVGPHSLRVSFEDNEAAGFNYMQRGDYPYQIQPPFASRPPQFQTLRREAGTVRYNLAAGPLLNLQALAANSKVDFFAPNSSAERFISRVRNADLRNEFTSRFGGVINRTTVGVDRFEDDGSSAFLNRVTRFISTENTGAYLQSRFNLGRHAFSAGVRRDDWETNFSTRTADGGETSLNARGLLGIGDSFALFAGYGEAARGYSTIPLQFVRNIVTTNLLFNGSASGGLRAETSRIAEVGARWDYAGLFATRDRGGVELKAYDTRIEDTILFRQPGSGGLGGRPVTDFYNYGDTARFYGVELNAEWMLGGYRGILSVIRPKTEDLPPDPQFIARFGAPTGGKLVFDNRYEWRHGLTFGYTLTAVRGVTDIPANQIVFIPRGGYVLHDVQTVWRPTAAPPLTLALAVTNLTDKRYSTQVTFTELGFSTQEPGRSVRVTGTLNF